MPVFFMPLTFHVLSLTDSGLVKHHDGHNFMGINP